MPKQKSKAKKRKLRNNDESISKHSPIVEKTTKRTTREIAVQNEKDSSSISSNNSNESNNFDQIVNVPKEDDGDSKFKDDKPYDELPNWVESRLKICVVDLFRDIKFFRDSKSVDRTPHLMDYIFKSLHLDDNDSISQKSM